MAKKCVVNKNGDGKVTSVEVQNLDIGTSTDNSYIDEYLKTVKESKLFQKVSKDRTKYETAVDNYIYSKVSNNQIMRDLGIDTRTEFLDTLAELNVPIKLPISEQQYNEMKGDLEKGMTKKDFLIKFKTGNEVYKFVSRGANIELMDRKETRETVKVKEIEQEIIQSIIADRKEGLTVLELYDKYHLPYGAISKILKINDAFIIKTDYGVIKNIYSANKGRIPYQSEKLGKWIMGDSTFEIARFMELDNDPNVLTYTRDVDPIPYKDNTNRRYFPDIKVTYTDGRIEIEEIKPFLIINKGEIIKQLREQGMSEKDIQKEVNLSDAMYKIVNKNIIKMDAAIEHYKNIGVDFKILTQKDIDVRLADYSSLTKLSEKDKKQLKKDQKALELKQKKFIPSQLYDELTQQPFVDTDQALDAYKNIYSDDIKGWKDSELDC